MSRRLDQTERAAPFTVSEGMLVLWGFTLRVAVERGHLLITDETFGVRRVLRLSRIDRDVRRLVVVGSSGSITLDAIKWLDGVGLPLVHLHQDGRVLMVVAPSAAHRPPVRRAQALAAMTPLGLALSRELVRQKIRGHLTLADRIGATAAVRQDIALALRDLDHATDFETLRQAEARAAQAYWSGWRQVPVSLTPSDRRRLPSHWGAFGGRHSPLGGRGANRAVTPGNAVLNYLFAILEAEARIACLAVGLDPMLGLLHTDRVSRDALALDLMEPVRPAVEGYVLDLLASRTFGRAELFELPDGQCRLLPPLTETLARTAPRWARLILPVAQTLATALQRAVDAGTFQPAHAAETPRRRRKRPQMRAMREFDRRPDPTADPRYHGKSVVKRQRTMDAVYHANARWTPGRGAMTREHYVREVVPRLKGVTLPALMAATGLSNASCSTLRRGLTVPHPRHWGPLARLARE